MQKSDTPFVRDLVFVGGGHSHAIVMNMWAMQAIEGVQLTLVSDVTHTPYSGMLPGHLAGFYDYDEIHIDLRQLCKHVGARYILDKAKGIDLEKKQLFLANHPQLNFDVLSINIGSTPARNLVPGAELYTTASKPVPIFLEKVDQVLAEEKKEKKTRIFVVGGGAGGVEIALCLDRRMNGQADIHILHQHSEIMEAHNPGVRRRLFRILQERGIQVHLNEEVTEVKEHELHCASGSIYEAQHIFWVTHARGAPWLGESGLQTVGNGFIHVTDTLQSITHPDIFAAGDIATMVSWERPKAGVFAVRQGKPLFRNLRRHFAGKPLYPYHPQKAFLSLIGTASKSAVASRGPFVWQSSLMWKWKDYIDRKFMKPFTELHKQAKPEQIYSQPKDYKTEIKEAKRRADIRCVGCAAKISAPILRRVLKRIAEEWKELFQKDGVSIGLQESDDAAVLEVPEGKSLVQSIDFLPAIVSDPYTFGKIVVNHSFNDIFAMGADAHSAQVLVGIPYAAQAIVEGNLYQLLCGVLDAMKAFDAVLLGGHSSETKELSLGILANGFISKNNTWTKGGMKPGEVLIMSKALGTGVLFAADMQLNAKGRWIDSAIESMLQSNDEAAKILRKYGATACTDISGFGFLGHLAEMLEASGCGAIINGEAIPVLEGAKLLIQEGWRSSIHQSNQEVLKSITLDKGKADKNLLELLYDPQTSGPLLASIPADKANLCIEELKKMNFKSAVIGEVIPESINIFVN
ncbi:MAG: selenide, water dikinase SelD [Waddliaceae bacterium]|nr:selenide, water dikinase SelD [Waddliaceae bacterium]